MAEIATYTMIKTKTSYGTTGNECPTKTVIKAISSYISISNDSSYGANECVKLEDISASAYTFTVANNSKSVAAGGGTTSAVDFTSYKIVNSVQSNVSYSLTSTLPSWLTWNASARTFTAANNTGSARSFTATFTQAESGKTVTASVSQAAVSITYGEWKVSVSANPTTIAAAGGTSTITATAVRDVFTNGVKTGTDTATPTLSISGTGFTLSGTTVTASNNTGSARSCTVTASHGGKTATATITQSAANISYTFTINGGASTSFSFSNTGGTSTSFTFVSTKTVNGTASNISYSQTSTLPSWLTWNSSNRQLTATANTGAERTATVTFTQAESNKTVSITVVQGGGAYVFLIDNKSSQDASFSYGANDGSVYITSTLNGSGTPWTVDSTTVPSWITMTTSNGTGSTTCTFSVSANSATTDRSVTIKFIQTSSGSTVTLLVKQSGAEEQWSYNFSINPWKIEVDQDGGTGLYVGINSTKTKGSQTLQVNYDVLGSSLPSWATFNKSTSQFTIQPSSTSRQQDVYFVQDETGNRDYARLIQTVSSVTTYIFTWGDGTTVNKTGTCPATFTSPFHLGDTQGVISKKTTTGQPDESVNYTIEKPSWITSIEVDEDMVYVTGLQNNTSTSSRSGVLKLTQATSGKTLTMNVTQSGKAADVYVFTVDGAASTSKTAAAAGGSVSTNIVSTKNGTGCPWTLYSNSASWAHPSASGTGNAALSITCDANDGTASRSAVIVYNQTGSNNRVTITITQGLVDGFSINPTTKTLSANSSGDQSISVYSIVSGTYTDWTYEIESGFNWWSSAARQGDRFVFGVYKNTGATRTGHITFTQAGTGKTAVLTIIQEGVQETCTIHIRDASYAGDYKEYGMVVYPEYSGTDKSLLTVSYRFVRNVSGTTGQLVSSTHQFTLLGISNYETPITSSETGDNWEYVELVSVTPTSDDKYQYKVSSDQIPIAYTTFASGNLALSTSNVPSDSPVPISLTNVNGFEGTSIGGASSMKLPAKYNPNNGLAGGRLSGTLSCYMEARNNTEYSMKNISIELRMTDQESYVGTDEGFLIKTWEQEYPVGGLYITLEVNSSPFDQTINADIPTGNDVYFYFVAKVSYTGSDTPTLTCNSSSLSMRVDPA